MRCCCLWDYSIFLPAEGADSLQNGWTCWVTNTIVWRTLRLIWLYHISTSKTSNGMYHQCYHHGFLITVFGYKQRIKESVPSSLPYSTLCPGNKKSGDSLDESFQIAGKGVNATSEIRRKSLNGSCPAVPLAQQGQIRSFPRLASLSTVTWRAAQQHWAPHSA